jgi:hypothetical protein
LMPGAEEQDYVLEWRTTSTRRSSTLLVATTRRWPSTSALAMCCGYEEKPITC